MTARSTFGEGEPRYKELAHTDLREGTAVCSQTGSLRLEMATKDPKDFGCQTSSRIAKNVLIC